MNGPVAHRVLHARWVPLQQAEENLRNQADDLRREGIYPPGPDAAREQCEQAIAALEACADDLRARWLPHEVQMPEEDRLVAEAMQAFIHGRGERTYDGDIATDFETVDLTTEVRAVGLQLYTRYLVPGVSVDPELLLVADHFSA